MSKKKSGSESAAPTPQTVKPLVPVLMLSISAVASLLALFQWMELLVLRAGGSTICGVNDVVNCQAVWETGFASAIHNRLGIPVAGLGLVWGLAAFVVSAAWAHDLLSGKPGHARAAALKLLALGGVAAVVVFAGVSLSAGALCLTCLGTYAVVAAFAAVAFLLIPGGVFPTDPEALKVGGMWAATACAAAYLVALGPGMATPRKGQSDASRLSQLEPVKDPGAVAKQPSQPQAGQPGQPGQPQAPSRPMTAAEQQAVSFLKELPLAEQKLVSNASFLYANGPKIDDAPEPRLQYGPRGAPVKLVEWVDIMCPHCRSLVETLHELKRVVPAGMMTIEPRNYPLDRECNPGMRGTDGSGIRCLAAKAMICLEGAEDYWDLRLKLFQAQRSLTKDKIWELASSGKTSRGKLEQCVASAETAQKLQSDIDYANKFNPQGTPLAVVNGRTAMPTGSFLYALIMAQGDAQSPVFQALPPPAPAELTGHEGHGH